MDLGFWVTLRGFLNSFRVASDGLLKFLYDFDFLLRVLFHGSYLGIGFLLVGFVACWLSTGLLLGVFSETSGLLRSVGLI